MLLFVLTSEGTAREDASVYYAEYLLVNVPDSLESQVQAAIEDILTHPGTRRMPHSTGEIFILEVHAPATLNPATGRYDNDPVGDLAGSANNLARRLTELGFPALAPSRTGYVVREG